MALLGILLLPVVVRAKLCGDDVRGRDVPCACGDIVASNLVLTNDPVASTVCAGDGLIVRAMRATSGITIDLAGHTLRGRGRGTGLWVIYGGPGGARIVSSGGVATIAQFRDGVSANGVDALVLLDGVVVERPARDGVRVSGMDYEIRAAEVRDAGRDGFALRGKGARITRTQAMHSGRFGYFVFGGRASIGLPGAGNAADASGEAGFHLQGMGNRLVGCSATNGLKDGVALNGMQFEVTDCVAEGNLADGIAGDGGGFLLTGNQALDNGRNGIAVNGVHHVDGGGNSGSDNVGRHQRRPPVQCAIGGVPCVP